MSDMLEKVLILCRNEELVQELLAWFQQATVDEVKAIFDEKKVRIDRLADRYNIIIIDKQFCGTGRTTATFVRRIRQKFFDPMIGIELMAGDGYLFSLQVAGCNFTLSLSGVSNAENCKNIFDLIFFKIFSELAEPHQHLRKRKSK